MDFKFITPTFCKLCGSSKAEEILNINDCADTYFDYLGVDYSSMNRFFKKCLNCGLIYKSIYMTEATKEKYYNRFRDIGLRNETHEEYFKRITRLPSNKSENFERYKFLKPFLKDRGKHMDIGGGLGVFCYGFQNFFPNWKSLNIEPTDGADKIAKKHGVLSYNMYLTESSAELLGQDFDLITVNHVLEHVDKPINFLKLLKSFMKNEGLIFIDVPSSLDIGYLDKTHDRFMSHHEVIFDNNIIEQIAIEAGLKILLNENYQSKRERNNIRALLKSD